MDVKLKARERRELEKECARCKREQMRARDLVDTLEKRVAQIDADMELLRVRRDAIIADDPVQQHRVLRYGDRIATINARLGRAQRRKNKESKLHRLRSRIRELETELQA